MPIFVLALTAGWITWQSLQQNRSAEQTAALMESLELQDDAGSAVATERATNIAAELGIPGAKKALVEAQEATDRALDARDDAIEVLDVSALPTNVQDAVNRTLRDRTVLDDLQRNVISGQLSESRATERYTALIENALDVPRAVAQSSDDGGLTRHINAYAALDEAMLANTMERPVAGAVLGLVGQGEAPPSDLNGRMVNLLQTTDSLIAGAQEQLDLIPGGLEVPGYEEDLDRARLQLRYLNLSGIDPEVASQWNEISQAWVASAQPVRDEARQAAVDYANDLAGSARTAALLTGAAAFGVVLVSFLLALLIARRIVQPLARLTSATAEVRDRLPRMVEQMAVPGQAPSIDLVQVPVESSDEIGRLAAAFNEVNETTMVVAREQAALRGSIAEMFVNVARRDQVLLNRQLSFLDELERSEEDPSTLSNLFRLDHLATRMRRNAESLLVLAGIDSGRRVRNPMPVSDVVRTASSEIELYDRVRLDLGVDPHMLGHNALSSAHLLAELLENATMFSEPHTPVEVSTARDERGVVVTVRDHGLGMSPEEIADANAKVSSRSASDAVGAQRLGLFVVGRLADRLKAQVRFQSGASGSGTEVTVVFPADLFLPDDALPLPQPTDPLETATQNAAADLGGQIAEAFHGQVSAPTGVQADAGEAAARFAPDEVEPPTMPTPAVASAASVGLPVEPEPPAAVPVDLDALTDGTTSVGMPRRRRSGVGSGEAVTRPDTGPIVLPPLATPELPDLVDEATTDSWRPPAEVEASTGTLPSRHRAQPEPVAEPEPVSAPVLGVDQRAGLFSSFRSMGSLDAGENESTLQLDAVTEDPAALPGELAPLAPADHAPAAPAAPAPAQAVAPLSAQDVPVAAVPTQQPAPPAPVDPAPAAPPAEPVQPEPYRPATQAAPAVALPTREVAPAEPEPVRPVAPVEPEPVHPVEPFEPQAPVGEQARYEPAPAAYAEPATSSFDPVVREVTEPAAGQAAAPAAEPTFAPVTPPAPSSPFAPTGSPAPEEAARQDRLQQLPPFEELIADLPTRRATRETPAQGGRKRGLFGRKPSADEPAAPAVPTSAPFPAAPRPAPEPARTEAPAFGGTSAYEAPRAAAPQDDAAWQEADEQDAPAAATSYGGSVLPLRPTEPAGHDPLDPHFVPDTVEARSEWMASAVLYEEMSTMLQRGVFQEGNVTSTNEQTYRPTTVANEAGGLARRQRAGESTASTERFTARIERDPEQLRSRLSAFQSATSRGRNDAGAVQASTQAAPTVNDVPGSAPHQR
ncbi:ATP-binding protein [Isoptericola sp. NPDC019693]|uniref:sensor histidine kinase n=1 Tax=Isoptericola sp. NPDC019693 TaxID=3364009 RepID=UPI0037A0C5AA